MVGAKSLGCLECKRRKVKCDQRLPKCANCERLGRGCSGPKSHFIRFVRPGAEEHMKIVATSESGAMKSPARTASELLAVEFVRRLEDIEEVRFQLQFFGAFVPFLPSRIGHNVALDAAVRCLLQSHKSLLYHRENPHAESLHYYYKAITLIKKDLDDLETNTPSETVCAALVLSLYELNKQKECRNWLTHAGGVAAILECWGPDRIVSDFELAIFASHYGPIISTSFLVGKPCFLNSPKWLSLRAKSIEALPQLDRYSADALTALAALPTLLRDIRRATSGTKIQLRSSLLCRLQEFKAQATQHSVKLDVDFENPTIVWEVQRLSADSNQTMIEFCTPQLAFRFNMYWATIIIANKLLLLVGEQDESLVQECKDAAKHICSSVEYVGSLRPLGAIWMTFVASTAYGVSEDADRQRIVDAVEVAYDPVHIYVGPEALQITFDLLTCGM